MFNPSLFNFAHPGRRSLAVAVAGTLALSVAAPNAWAVVTLPSSLVTYYGIETPYDPTQPIHPGGTAYFQFQTVADLQYGLTVGGNIFNTLPLGSFQGSATGLTLGFGSTGVTARMTSSATQFAKVQSGPDPTAFVDAPANSRYVHVGSAFAPGLPALQETTLLTLQFSRPIYGFSFQGAGISDYGGSGVAATGLAQKVRLDGGAAIDVVNVDPGSIFSPMQMSFGVISPQAFSSVSLVLPQNSHSDNAAIRGMLIAYDPLSPVPEPGTAGLLLAGMAAIAAVARRRGQRMQTEPGFGSL